MVAIAVAVVWRLAAHSGLVLPQAWRRASSSLRPPLRRGQTSQVLPSVRAHPWPSPSWCAPDPCSHQDVAVSGPGNARREALGAAPQGAGACRRGGLSVLLTPPVLGHGGVPRGDARDGRAVEA